MGRFYLPVKNIGVNTRKREKLILVMKFKENPFMSKFECFLALGAVRKSKKSTIGLPPSNQEDSSSGGKKDRPLERKSQKSLRCSTDLRISWSGSIDEKYFQVYKRVSTIKLLWDMSSQQKIVCHPEQSCHDFAEARYLSVGKMVSNCVQSTILSPFEVMKETKVQEERSN